MTKTLIKTILVLVALLGAIWLFSFVYYKNMPTNLVQGDDWKNFPGATITSQGIHFAPLDRVIVHQDGSVGQPNPPVGAGVQHLQIVGDFKITATLSQIDKQASFRLYASPPIVYDQWRAESPSVEMVIDTVQKNLTARIWDGTSSASMDMRQYTKVEPWLNSAVTISLEHKNSPASPAGGHITISLNNRVLGTIPDHHIFDRGTIWFGADGAVNSRGWTLSNLQTSGNVKVINPPSLIASQKSAGVQHLQNTPKFGTAVALGPLLTNPKYAELALSQFEIITPENAMKPQFIHPQEKVYDFSEADQLVDIALQNNIAVHGHALVYDKSSPGWMTQSEAPDRQKIMTSHIQTVVTHFKGKVAGWDVVNEPFSQKHALYGFGKSGLQPNLWFAAMGENYIDLAFRTAHAADPQAKLYLNDYGIENDGQHWDAMLALVKRLQKRGVPIDGVGFEAHIYSDGDYIHADQLKNHMKILADLGLLTRISEIDVTGEDPKEQINQYVLALDACLNAKNCTSYTTWGITDLYGSTTRSDRYPTVLGTSLLWDKDFKPKPTEEALQKRLGK